MPKDTPVTHAQPHEEAAPAQRLSFVAAQASWCGELDAAARFSAEAGAGVIVASANAAAQARSLHTLHPGARITVDTMAWRRTWASTESPSPFHPDARTGTMFGLDRHDWADEVRRQAGVDRICHPGYTVPAGDGDILDAAIIDALTSGSIGLEPILALDNLTLAARHLDTTLDVIARYSGQRLIIRFNSIRAHGLAKFDRMVGLRQLLTLLPGLELAGVDIVTGLDALAHRAGHVAIGASSSHRFPRNPDGRGSGSGNANGFKPGTWNRELMATHSPDHYADWYVQMPSPVCMPCERPLDVFDSTVSDKTAAIAHNLHGTYDHIVELLVQPQAQRITWLALERLAAFERHAALMSAATRVTADPMLRVLVSIDDPGQRETSPDGHFQTI